MNEQQYNNQSLNEYLLGALPEAEAERFDELSFTDDEFADALAVAEKDLVDAYIQEELSGATLEQFKTRYLASPLRREKVEFAKAFQVYAEKNIAASEAKAPAAVETKPKRNPNGFFAGIFTFSRPAMSWGLAFAALALVFFGGWLWRENSRQSFEMSRTNSNREEFLQRETELARREEQSAGEDLTPSSVDNSANDSEVETEPAQAREERAQTAEQLKRQRQERRRLAELRQREQRAAPNAPPVSPNRGIIAAFVLAPSLRGGSRIQTVSIPANTATVAASLELESDEYTAYRAILRNPADNRVLWQSGKLKSKSVGADKQLKLAFPAKLLKPEIYSIEVSGISADGAAEIIGDYSFRVVR